MNWTYEDIIYNMGHTCADTMRGLVCLRQLIVNKARNLDSSAHIRWRGARGQKRSS